ncbi:MAG: DUF4157 domain-containing protein [Rhodospirillales bacterium]|nr:DUF4157 domain-containing protein [Rhodospirillales bacterium]
MGKEAPAARAAEPAKRQPQDRISAADAGRGVASLPPPAYGIALADGAGRDEAATSPPAAGWIQPLTDPELPEPDEDPLAVSPRLIVGAPDDPFEQEAEAAAAAISRGERAAITHRPPPTVREDEEEEPVEGTAVRRLVAADDQFTTTRAMRRPAGGRSRGAVAIPAAAASAVAAPGPGSPLPAPTLTALQRGFGADLSGVRVHADPQARQTSAAISARAFTHRDHIWLGPNESAGDIALMAHEAAHVLQQRGSRHTVVRRETGRSPPPVDEAAVEAWLRNPPPARMRASIARLEFHPVETSLYVPPDRQLCPTAVVFGRLSGPGYNPAWVREFHSTHSDFSWDWRGREELRTEFFYQNPNWATRVLAFLSAPSRLGDRIEITAEQRALVTAGEALNPVPREILEAQATIISVGAAPTPNFLARRQEILNQLATMWWDRTQAYVRAYLVWRGDPTEDHLWDAALALDELFAEFDPYNAALRAIYDDIALQALPAWSLLWPPLPNGERRPMDRISPTEAVAFTRYATSQPRNLMRLVRTDAAARRSLLEGYAAFRGRLEGEREGDQPVSSSPSPYNAAPLPVTMHSYPRIEPPLFAAATSATTTFYASIRFETVFEALQQAFGGWQYAWEAIRVPNDDLTTLGTMSIPPEPPAGWDAVQQDLARDLRYARADMQRIRSISRLTSLLGPPGVNAETLVGANLIMDLAGTMISHGIRELTRPSSEFDVRFREEGLYLIRLRVGPRLADEAEVAHFRRAPSVAWMPVYARPPRSMGEDRLRLEVAGLNEAEARYWELRSILAEPVSHENEEDLRRELRELHLGLFGSTLDILRDQRRRLNEQLERIEAGRATAEDRAVSLTQLRERIRELDLMIGMREDRASRLRGTVMRLPATLAKDDGTVIHLSIEAAEVSSTGPRWYVSDLTTPRSGHREATGDGTLAPDYPAEDSILRALKTILESPSGYGRGYLSVWFEAPLSGPGRIRHGLMRGIRIETDEAGIAIHGIESLTTLISIGAVVAAPFTGGASLVVLMPVGIIGAIPSAYRLIHRSQMGTLRFDVETAMQIVDIAAAALQVGEIGAGMRAAARAGTRAGLRWAVVEGSLWVAGIGANGLGMLLMGAGLMEQLRSLDGLPPGLRAARMTEILGNAMLTIGIQAGAHLASRAHLAGVHESVGGAAAGADRPGATVRPPSAVEPAAAPRARPAGRTEAPRHIAAALPADLARTTPLDIDPALRGNTVHVDYRIGANGRVDPASIRMVASPHATAGDIALHVEAARTLHAYAGLLGGVHEGLERLRAVIGGGRRAPEQGSAAWEAQLEFAKLNTIIRDRLRRLSTLPVDEARAAEIAVDIENLRAQLAEAERILAGLDPADPRGFIAAESPEQRATRIAQNNRETVIRLNIADVVLTGRGVQVRQASEIASGRRNPAPGYHFREVDGRIVMSRNSSAGTAPHLMLVEHRGRLYIVPEATVGATVSGAAHLNSILAQIDEYPPPLRGHSYRPDGDGWQLRHDGFSSEPPQRITRRADGTFEYSTPPERPTFADRQRTAVQTQPAAEGRNAFLEAELTRRGIAATDEQRAILRRWSAALSEIGRIAEESLGRNMLTEAEVARLAVAALAERLPADGRYIEARYDAFRYALRDAALAAVFGFSPDAMQAWLVRGEALPSAPRTPAEQRALYDRLYATLPDQQSRGELWARYREARGRLSAERGGFGDFRHLPLAAGHVLQHTPETRIDGAIDVPADVPDGPPAGRYGLESKAGGSYDAEQAGRYSTHLTDHDGHVVMSDGETRYDGVVYLFDNIGQAQAAVTNLDRTRRHGSIFVAYVDGSGRVRWLPRAAAPAASAGPR